MFFTFLLDIQSSCRVPTGFPWIPSSYGERILEAKSGIAGCPTGALPESWAPLSLSKIAWKNIIFIYLLYISHSMALPWRRSAWPSSCSAHSPWPRTLRWWRGTWRSARGRRPLSGPGRTSVWGPVWRRAPGSVTTINNTLNWDWRAAKDYYCLVALCERLTFCSLKIL